jgi:hypothetical protein
MTEPIYEYVKGQGWILNHVESFELELYDGRAKFEFRKPNLGEKCARFSSVGERDQYILDLKRHPRSYEIEYYPIWDSEDTYYTEYYTEFLTLIPL